MGDLTLALGGGLLESVGQLAAIAGTLVLVLLLVGLGWFGYVSLRGDGVEWPADEAEADGVQRGDEDDEWEFY